jgi:hypothetical protein
VADVTSDQAPQRVDKLSWVSDAPQLIHCHWRQVDRVCRYVGQCAGCQRRTYAFDDGENDPRGVLGDRAYWPVEGEDGLPVLACAVCANDYETYQRITR